MARALTADAGGDVGAIAFAAVLSWIAGFLAVPVPGGVGVREAVFVAAAGLDPGVGAAVALVTRAVFMAVDAAGALGAAAWLAHREAGTDPSGSLDAAAGTGEPAATRRRGR